jgi:outer membrane protein assembly factor BamA
VRVETQDVFRPNEAGERFVPRLVNSLHVLTRKETVMREVFVQPGDLVDVTHAAELERNLRALGIFAEVEVRLVPATTEGEADLVVRTRDRLTLAAGGGASPKGG